MIRILNESVFCLETKNTAYLFQKLPSGHLEHLYYGASVGHVTEEDARALSENRGCETGNMISYSQEQKSLLLEDTCLEMSSEGKGDIREPSVEIVHADGSRTSDFLFESAEILEEKAPYTDLPGSYGMEPNNHLLVTLRDSSYSLKLELHYYVYEEEDVICRSSRLVNESNEKIRLERLMSSSFDLRGSGYGVTSFTGAWAKEMNRKDVIVRVGKYEISSFAGASSNRANPFVMIHEPGAGETFGSCIGMNLIYSGNHAEIAEVSPHGKTRIMTGINPRGFSFLLSPGDVFQAPEAVLTFSDSGFRMLSQNMHAFIREHIVRGEWKKKPRPVLINSWEASYFKFNERKLLRLAKAAKGLGIELFVLDDGWFGQRNDDSHSLGDWTENRKKLPDGLSGLSRKIRKMGMEFGIWVEPEMVNQDSDLYRAHPDWVLQIPGKPHSEGRNQRILDLTNPEVVDYLTETMRRVFQSAEISYVKWDMNRIFSDAFSPYLPAEQQGEVFHRYILGLYRLMDRLTKEFPMILFEGCAAGGCRFDLGILCYFPQIWASDNTDPICRAGIQEGYSFGYPLSVLSSHVSASPNHQTLRKTSLYTRFAVSCFGLLGYELNLPDFTKKEKEEVRRQIAWYKKWREVLQNGTFYRLTESASAGDLLGIGYSDGSGYLDRIPAEYQWMLVSEDRKKALGLTLQTLVRPNVQVHRLRAAGLDPEGRYSLRNLERQEDIRRFGDLINTEAPVHIRPGSLAEKAAAKFVKLDGEKERYSNLFGALLMNGGVSLTSSYTGTGIGENVRVYQDFDSRLYVIESETSGSSLEKPQRDSAEVYADSAGKNINESEKTSAENDEE
ncbi:MAG: alpha-galactosidase [Eubacteriales bacterium]|nr:alpha-galactosidase [Eubacteriales bacterium]